MVLHNECRYSRGDMTADVLAFGYHATQGGTANIVQRGIDEADGGRQRQGIDGVALAGIDYDGIVSENLRAVSPFAKEMPVVGSYQQYETVLRIVGRELAQRVVSVGRA